jgi:hypothetical protein
MLMNRWKLPILVFILVLGFSLRLYRFDNPVADWHSWRQADTSSVSRNFVEKGFDVLHPTYHDLSNVPTGKYENPKGYRFVEFPIYNIFQAGFYKLFGIFSLEQWGRLVTIFSSLLSSVFIYLIVRKYADTFTALASSAVYTFIPYNIYYGRVILPEPMTVAAFLGGIYFFILYIDRLKQKTDLITILLFIISAAFIASSLLLKPFAIFFTFPLVAIAFNEYKLNILKRLELYLFLGLCILPFILWRVWITQFPEGVPISAWLFNGGGIRFTGAFFNWIFAKRIGELILGFWGIGFLILGLLFNTSSDRILKFRKGQQLLFWSFLISLLTYVTVIARGNIQHDYYQILIIPSLAIFAGLGLRFLLFSTKEIFDKRITILIVLVCLSFAFAFRWYVVRDYFNINNPSIISAGKAVDRLTPKDAKVIANYEGDTTFLYQTKRSGWASYTRDIVKMRDELGAEYLAIANPVESDMKFANEFSVVERKKEYIIFDLRKQP